MPIFENQRYLWLDLQRSLYHTICLISYRVVPSPSRVVSATANSCSQHFMKIKRQSAGNAAESAHNSPTKSSNANVTTPGKARKSPSKATTTTSARKPQDNTSTRKRKNDAVDLEDDDLGSPSGNHAKKMKAELEVDGAPGDQSLLFKVEDGKTVDLEHDEFVPLPPLYPFPRLKVHSHYN